MGEKRSFRPRPSAENPKGFYENIRFRALSDRILNDSAYQVKSWNPFIPPIRATGFTRFRARRLLAKYCRAYSAWGWKDPRVCLTLGVWLEELDRLKLRDQVKLLYIFRRPASVARSMVIRGNTDYEGAIRLWTVYNRRALDAIDRRSVASRFVTYDELCHEALQTAATVIGFLGTQHDPLAVSTFIDERLDRSSLSDTEDSVGVEVETQTRDVEADLRRRHRTPRSSDTERAGDPTRPAETEGLSARRTQIRERRAAAVNPTKFAPRTH